MSFVRRSPGKPRHHGAALCVLFSALLLTGILAWRAPSRTQAEAPSPLEHRRRPSTVLSAETAIPQPVPLSLATVPAAYGECLRVAAQGWQDNTWEIYTFRANGSGLRRLTDETEYDTAPSMGESCDLIVFESERDGNVELYSMNGLGDELQRLTDNSLNDYWPNVSPDGSYVVFRREGSSQDYDEAEIYKLRLSDRAETRLTLNSTYDDRPVWSPDGSQIAFVSDRDTDDVDAIWIMDADGSDAHQILDDPIASALAWSPDGDRIAFAAYPGEADFAELWIVDTDGTDARWLYTPSTANTSVEPGGWTPDGLYILYEETTWVQQGSTYYVSSSRIYMLNPDDVAERYLLSPSGIFMAPDIAACDDLAPTSSVHALPAQSTQPFQVSWSGQDACSDTIEFQVQVRRGAGGTWQDWQVTSGQAWTTATQGSYSGATTGETVYFRSRARDEAGNVEEWPTGDGDTHTVIQTSAQTVTPTASPSPSRTRTPSPTPTATPRPGVAMVGAVCDVRGVALPYARVRGLAPAGGEAQTNAGGYYELQLPLNSAVDLRADAVGYLAQTLSRPDSRAGQGASFYLSASPELALNGGFENGAAAWYARGIVEIIGSSSGYGDRVAQLGSPLTGAAAAALTAWPSHALWQIVTIPADAQNPTLSWVYAMPGETPAGTLRVLLGPEGPLPEVWNTTQTSAWTTWPGGSGYPVWQHGQLDLTPWRGQTVRVEFSYVPGAAGRTALLDAVSVSPWLTPRVDAVAPAAVGVGQSITLTVTGRNFEVGAQVQAGNHSLATERVSQTQLRVTLRNDLPKGCYDVLVENPSGRRSALVQALTIGGRAQLPLILRR